MPVSGLLQLADGSSAGVCDFGDPHGTPVLALHGSPASRLMFAGAGTAAREAGLRLVCVDRPGYGLTPPDAQASLAARTQWLQRVADAAGLDRFAILAISGGAPYATALAARLGTRVTALALVSPMGPVAELSRQSAQGLRAVPFVQRRFFLHLPRRWFFPGAARLLARAFMASPRGFSGFLPRLAGDPDAAILARPHVRQAMLDMTREAVRNGPEGGIDDLRIFSQPWDVDYAAIAAPATLWLGTQDRIVPAAAARHLARKIPHCSLVQIDGGGHFWVFEHVAEICAAIRRMIAESGSDPAIRRGP